MVLDDVEVDNASIYVKENAVADKQRRKKKKSKKDKILTENENLKKTNFINEKDKNTKCQNDMPKKTKKMKLKRSCPTEEADVDCHERITLLDCKKNKIDTLAPETPIAKKSKKEKSGKKKSSNKKQKKDSIKDEAEYQNYDVANSLHAESNIKMQTLNSSSKIEKKKKSKRSNQKDESVRNASETILKHKKCSTDASTSQVLKSQKIDKSDKQNLKTFLSVKLIEDNQKKSKSNEPIYDLKKKTDKKSKGGKLQISETISCNALRNTDENCESKPEILSDTKIEKYDQENPETNINNDNFSVEDNNQELINKNEKSDKYKNKRNCSKKQKLPEKKVIFTFNENHPAIVYLSKWKNDKKNWTFKKIQQIWLLQHLYDEIAIPDNYFTIMLEYLIGSQGNAKTKTLQDAEKFFNENCGKENENNKQKLKRCREIIQILSS